MALSFKLHGANAGVAMMGTLKGLLNSGVLKIYTGAQPANPNTAVSGTLLAVATLNATAFPAGVAVEGTDVTLTANAITGDSSNDNSGVAGYFRLFQSDGTTAICDGSCGDAGDAPVDMQLANKTLVAGGTFSVTSFTIKLPLA